MPSPIQLHVAKYRKGCGSEMCSGVKHIVFARGTIPCDVLFIGEAPGESEDVCGQPFRGPAGKLLDHMIAMSGIADWSVGAGAITETDVSDGERLRLAFGNIVNCVPRDGAHKASEPTKDQILQCSGRLQEFIKICDPKLIICVGKLAAKWLDQDQNDCIKIHKAIPMAEVHHPAYILRSTFASQGLLRQTVVATLRSAVEEVFVNPVTTTVP